MPHRPKNFSPEKPPVPTYYFPARLMSAGDGSYILLPGKPVAKLSVQECARATGLSRKHIHRLIEAGLLEAENPGPRIWLVYWDDVVNFLEASKQPGFWDEAKRRAYITGKPPGTAALPKTAPFDPRKAGGRGGVR